MQKKILSFSVLAISLLFSYISFGQKSDYSFAALEYSIGKTSTANVNFPALSPQQGVLFTFGSTNNDDSHEWKRQLNHPETGVTFSYVSLGNSKSLINGRVVTI